MAYVTPAGTTKLIDAATVNNGAYSTVAAVSLRSTRSPVVFYVNCNQTYSIYFGTAGQDTTTQAELDRDSDATRTGVAATATFGSDKYTFWPDAGGGEAWCQIYNGSGSAATLTVYGGQL